MFTFLSWSYFCLNYFIRICPWWIGQLLVFTQYALCSALSSSRSLWSASRIFLINFLRFNDQRTPLMRKISSWKSWLSCYLIINFHHLRTHCWPHGIITDERLFSLQFRVKASTSCKCYLYFGTRKRGNFHLTVHLSVHFPIPVGLGGPQRASEGRQRTSR